MDYLFHFRSVFAIQCILITLNLDKLCVPQYSGLISQIFTNQQRISQIVVF